MERFEWQTEEEGPLAAPSETEGAGKRYSLKAVAIVAGLLIVAFVIVWQMGRQAAAEEETVREDVKAAFGIWKTAIDRRDEDLLDTLLMAAEAEWTATQRELLASGKSLDRSGIGLALVESGREVDDESLEIDVSSDWRAAEISFPTIYRPLTEQAEFDKVRLTQTVMLAREGSRWLLRRPEEDFWGEWHTLAGKIAEVSFRERDADFAERMLDDLDRDLGEICSNMAEADTCPAETKVNVRLESDAGILLRRIEPDSPAFAGKTFVLPTPTLAGRPFDDVSYRALYTIYTRPILATFEASITLPEGLPTQIVNLICFSPYGNLPRLYSYDPALDIWSAELEGNAFRFLTATADDSAVAMRQHMPREPNRLRLVQWSAGRVMILHDETFGPLTDHDIGWVDTAAGSGLLLAQYSGTTRSPSYSLIRHIGSDSAPCHEGGCPTESIGGFPRWSPDGMHSLVLTDGQLYLADGNGQSLLSLGEGQSPFWLDEQRFGFIRPVPRQQRQVQELVIGATNEPGLISVWTSDTSVMSLIGATAKTPFYIQHVAPVGGDQPRLLLYGRQYAGEESRYAILSLPLEGARGRNIDAQDLVGPARLELLLDRSPAGLPSPTHPNGHVPFVVSPDGRWLTAAHLVERGANEWLIHVAEIGRDNSLVIKSGYPGYSFSHPFFDWSLDGRWLLIIDREFLRLVAPEEGFERIIAHEQSACSYPAWINRHDNAK